MFQRPPQLRLKDNGQRQKKKGYGLLQQPEDRMKFHPVAHEGQSHENNEPLDQRDGPGIFQHFVGLIKNDGH